MSKRWLKEKEVSKMIGRSVRSLQNDRHRGKGLPYIKWDGGRQVRYDSDDIEKFMEQNKINPTRVCHIKK